jgi:hypothetical protein
MPLTHGSSSYGLAVNTRARKAEKQAIFSLMHPDHRKNAPANEKPKDVAIICELGQRSKKQTIFHRPKCLISLILLLDPLQARPRNSENPFDMDQVNSQDIQYG